MAIEVENTTSSSKLGLEVWHLEKCLAKSDVVLDPDHLFYYDIFFWFCVGMVLIFGLPMNSGIVYYEWFGGDSQKRSLVNRFISNGLICSYTGTICRLLSTALIR